MFPSCICMKARFEPSQSEASNHSLPIASGKVSYSEEMTKRVIILIEWRFI